MAIHGFFTKSWDILKLNGKRLSVISLCPNRIVGHLITSGRQCTIFMQKPFMTPFAVQYNYGRRTAFSFRYIYQCSPYFIDFLYCGSLTVM